MTFLSLGLGSQPFPQPGALFAGGQALGDPEEPSSHELRQAEPIPALLL